MHYYKYFGSNMDLQNSSQLESDDLHDLNNSDVTSDRKKGRTVCRKESTHFSGVGEEVSLMSETASSRACCLKHEGDCYSLETFFTSEDYKDLTGAQILETVIPVIEKYDASYLWDIFKSIVEKRMASPSSENLSETEWLKESTIRLAKILFYLPMKKMPSVVLEHLHSGIPVEKSQECIFSDSLKGVTGQPDVLSIEAKENSDVQDTSNYGPNVVKLLSKVDELHNQTVCLRDENTQIQEMLVEAGTKLKITSEENLQLKHQLLRAKVNLKEIDDLTSEIWSLKAKLTSYEHKERKKRKKLAEIENQRNVLFKRVQDVERKVQEWHAIVEDAKSEINALKNLVFTQERKIISVVQETTMTEIQLNELTQVKSELEKSVKELLEANDALRSDKRTLENHLAEMKLRLAKNDGITCIESVGCTDILYEDDSLAPQHEIISCSDSIHPSSVSTEGENIVHVHSLTMTTSSLIANSL